MVNSLQIKNQLVYTFVIISIIGSALIYSATALKSLSLYGHPYSFLTQHLFGHLIGFSMMYVLSLTQHQHIAKLSFLILVAQLIVTSFTFISPLSHPVNHFHRWVNLGFFTFQPSELAKFTVIIYTSWLLAKYKEKKNKWVSLSLLSLPLLFLLYMIFKQPDFGTTVLLGIVIFSLFFFVGVKLRYLLLALISSSGFLLYSLINSPYRMTRFLAYLNPWNDPKGIGFQIIRSFETIKSGGIFGKGLGNGLYKKGYLPELHTDFIFSHAGEELGFLGCVFIITALIYFGYLLFKCAKISHDDLGAYLCYGVAFCLMIQVSISLFGVVGLIPVKGLPLPFISWGRSSLVSCYLMLGIILSILNQDITQLKQRQVYQYI